MPASRPPGSSTTSAPMPFSAISRMASITAASGPIEWTSGPLDSSSCLTVRIVASLDDGWHGRAYPLGRRPVVDQVQRPLLGLFVKPAEVFPDQPERHQLDTAQEQDHRHHRRPAG